MMFPYIRKHLQAAIDDGVPFETAMDAMEKRILETESTTQSVVSEAVSIASRYVSRQAVQQQRSRIFNAAEKIAEDRKAGVEVLKERVANFMSFRLPGGKQISDATGDECREAASFYRALARTSAARANWLESVAAKAGSGIVKDRLSENELQAIYEEVGQ